MENIRKNIGKKESVYLVADDCGSYGKDIHSDIFHLIEDISREFPNTTIDLDYINPRWIAKYPFKYLNLFQKYNIGFCCIPNQSGSNKILVKMNRHYKMDAIIRFLKTVRKIKPNLLIISHFLIGFPGEKISDLLMTLRSVYYYDYGYPFSYTDREGTPSYGFIPKINPLIKNIRTKIVLVFVFVNFMLKIFGNLIFQK